MSVGLVNEVQDLACDAAESEAGRAPEAGLTERFARGEEAAFDEAVRLYEERLGRLALRLMAWRGGCDAEDALQEALVKAYVGRKRFRGESEVLTWLTRIVVNRCRSMERRRRLGLRVIAGWAGRRRETEERGVDETAEEVRRAVGKLAMREREVVVLYYLEELGAR
jgi:RNA polymerase sigma-70 factor (ECF subfamily)